VQERLLDFIHRLPRTTAQNRRKGIQTQKISLNMTSFPRGLKKDFRPMGEIFMGAQGKEWRVVSKGEKKATP
jgi:hypothetical protein